MNLLKKGLLMSAILMTYGGAQSQLIINELMQSNIDCVYDDLKEFPDSWVELYNAGSQAVQLSDYSIGTSEKQKKAYKLPSRMVSAGEHLLVYCDKVGAGMHASVRLESGKDGAVYLFKGSEVADRLTGMKKMPAPNITYGRVTDGADTWGYQLTPTPGKANCGQVTDNLLSQPVFSHPGGVLDSPFTLSLSLPEGAPEGSVIRYTLDGKEPTSDSKVYGEPIRISKSTTVRAKIYREGWLSPRSLTQSYIFLGHDMTMPVVSIVTDGDYFYSDSMGIYNSKNNGEGGSHDWRRPINIEVFPEAGKESAINQLCETRVKGGASRGAALKSLVLYANKRFGTKRLEHSFFSDFPELTDWKSVELRNAGNDFDYLYMRDAAIQRNMGRKADLDWAPYQPAIVFINGYYKGILNFRSRSNEDYVYTFYDGLEDVDVVENWYEIKEGEKEHLDAFLNFFASHDHTMADYEKVMDVGEFANLMILESFHNNLDFPGNNIEMWRSQAEEGRWRWIVKDTDFGLGLYNRPYDYKYLDWLYNPDHDPSNNWANKYEHTRLFRRLMELQEFKDMFIDRAAVYMGDFLNGTTLSQELDEMAGAIIYEYRNYHRPLFNKWWPNYDEELAFAKTWTKNRTEFFYQHIADFLKLGKPLPLVIDKDRTDEVRLSMNGIPVNARSFDGKFFAGRKLVLSAECKDENLAVTRWNIVANGSANPAVTLEGSQVEYVIPTDAKSVTISSVTGEGSGVTGVENDCSGFDFSRPVEYYNAAGLRMSSAENLPAGVYVMRQGKLARKIVIR